MGKSVLLDGIHVLCDPTQYDHAIHARKVDEDEYASEVTVKGTFTVTESDVVKNDFIYNKHLQIRHRFSENDQATEVYGEAFVDQRIHDFQSLNAGTQREVLESLGIPKKEAGSNKSKRIAQMDELIESREVPTERKWIEFPKQSYQDSLPIIQRIFATDFEDPDGLVRSALRRALRAEIHERDAETGDVQEIPEVQPLRQRLENALRREITKAQDILSRHHSKLDKIDVEPDIDFSDSLKRAYLMVNLGDGNRRLRSFGHGTKRRLWMGLLEWEGSTVSDEEEQWTIRLYDEPDVNLHYNAQRTLLENIRKLSERKGSKTQSFVSTHSVTFINRVPPKNIILLEVDEDGRREIRQVKGNEADDFSTFYNSIGASIGLSNAALLFEHGFFVVEGPSEFGAVPILYQKLYQTSMHQDHIKTINLDGCGSWRSVFRVLLRHRSDFVHVLLDSDCLSEDSTAKITPATFEELGIDDNFKNNNMTFIGKKEFEDAFSTDVIVRALNNEYERENGQAWTAKDVNKLRNEIKFSKSLQSEVRKLTQKENRSKTNKPDLAVSIAKHCQANEIPPKLLDALERIRIQAGIN